MKKIENKDVIITKDLISLVANETKFLKSPVEEIIETLEIIMENLIVDGKTVRLSFVEMGTREVKEVSGKRLSDGVPYTTPAHTVPYAKIRKTFKYKYLGKDYSKKTRDTDE